MKKIVGIITRPDIDFGNKYIHKVNEKFRTILFAMDLIPLPLMPSSTNNYYEKEKSNLNIPLWHDILGLCDGFLLQGGSNPHDYEIETIKYAYSKDIPLLGICMGMQSMSMFLGAELVMANSMFHQSGEHRIKIKKNSKLHTILNQETIIVNRRHKEKIINLKEKYISAKCNGVIEAIEDKSKRFYLGVQWHPEDIEDNNSSKLFEKFKKEIYKEVK